MVIPSTSPLTTKKPHKVPVINLTMERSKLRELIVKACEEFGVFQVENHGVSREVISRLENESHQFFSKPPCQKQRAGPASPFGYGCNSIGSNGDKGELEYILLQANPHSISDRAKIISPDDPAKFSSTVNDYIEAVNNLACDILEIAAEGLWVPDKSIFSKLIRDVNSDSCFRVNHYPPAKCDHMRVGFGEHSDPQIVTILRSNNVGGLQILSGDGVWIPVPPDSDKFCVFVGDAFQAMSNGRFTSVRHRVLANSAYTPRMSMMYFAAPPLNTCISAIPQLVTSQNPTLYRSFTWGEYKSTVYSMKLADRRLDLFTAQKSFIS